MPLMFGFDPLAIIVAVITGVISMIASGMVSSAFSKYSKVGNSRNLSGAEAAKLMLDAEGIHDIQIQRYNGGTLSDHFNPSTKIINLSPAVYDGRSVAAVGVACHEAGHALQHAVGYPFIKLRNLLVPTAGLGSKLGFPLIIAGVIFNNMNPETEFGYTMVNIGFILFSTIFLFQLVTLPVELNASSRSKHALVSHGIVASGPEARGVSAVLNAAALTYVAAAFTALLNLIVLAIRLGLFNRRRRD